MKPLADVWGRERRRNFPVTKFEWPLPEQLMGIEVEVEWRQSLPRDERPFISPHLFPYWQEKGDGSLQNGREYVLQSPMKGDMLSLAINAFFSEAKLLRAATSSTHIHIDMMEEGTGVNIIPVLTTLVYMLESAIFEIAGTGREWTGYTNRLATAPELLLNQLMHADIESNDTILRNVCSSSSIGRYYGFNVAALDRYGSIEFRYFPTATSAEELAGWVKLVQCFKQAAMAMPSVELLLSEGVETEDKYVDFIMQYFGDWSETIFKVVPWKIAKRNYARVVARRYVPKISSSLAQNFDPRSILENKKLARFARPKKKKDRSNTTITAPPIATVTFPFSSNSLRSLLEERMTTEQETINNAPPPIFSVYTSRRTATAYTVVLLLPGQTSPSAEYLSNGNLCLTYEHLYGVVNGQWRDMIINRARLQQYCPDIADMKWALESAVLNSDINNNQKRDFLRAIENITENLYDLEEPDYGTAQTLSGSVYAVDDELDLPEDVEDQEPGPTTDSGYTYWAATEYDDNQI